MWCVNRNRLLVLALLLLAEKSAEGLRAEVRITLRSAARTSGHEIRLGEVASLSGDPKQTHTLSSLVLGLAPSGDVDRLITRRDVNKALQKEGFSEKDDLILDGAESVRVRSQMVELSPEWIADSIRIALSKEYPENRLRLESLKVILPGRVLIPPDGTTLQPDLQHWRGKPDGMLTIHLNRRGQTFRSVRVRVEMSWEGQAPVSTRELPSGSLLQEKDVRWERRLHQGFPFDLTLEAGSLIGMRLRQTVKAGEYVRNSVLLPELLIAKGDLVEVTVKGNGFSVQTTAVAEQPGVSGQKVRLQQTSTKRAMIGRVIGKQKVEIRL